MATSQLNSVFLESDDSLKFIDIDSFSPFYGPLTIPSKTLLYRGYDSAFPLFQKRPAYFTSQIEVAMGYAEESATTRLATCYTSKKLKLYDLRFIKSLLKEIFTHRQSDSKSVIETCYTLALAYGVCSFEKQKELIKKRFEKTDSKIWQSFSEFEKKVKDNITLSGIESVETQGFRVAETINDAEAVLLLKSLLGHVVDGYIAPRFYSPFHVEKKNECWHPAEIVLFDPISCDLRELRDNIEPEKVLRLSIPHLFDYKIIQFPLKGYDKTQIAMMKHGGNEKRSIVIEDERNTFFHDDKNKKIIESLERKTKLAATRLVGKVKNPDTISLIPSIEEIGIRKNKSSLKNIRPWFE